MALEAVAQGFYPIVMSTTTPTTWAYLAPKRSSAYRQLFIKGRNVSARTLYGLYMSAEEPRTPEQIAADYDLPLEAVREAIVYCQSDPSEIREDWEREEAASKARAAKGSSSPYEKPTPTA